MKTIIVGKMACDDSILKAIRNITVEDLTDILSTAFSGSNFTVARVDLGYARVSEKYFLGCKELGYNDGFFRRNTILARCTLVMSGSNSSCFEGVYIPFSGEIYLIPEGVLEFADIPQDMTTYRGILSQNGEKRQNRLFNILLATEKTKRTFQDRLSGAKPGLPLGKAIASLEATADVRVKILGNGTTEEEVLDPMYFLYEE